MASHPETSTDSSDDFDDFGLGAELEQWLYPAPATCCAPPPACFYSDGSHASPLPPSFWHPLYTVFALAVWCEHHSMPLSRLHLKSSPSNCLWLPYVGLKDGFNYAHIASYFNDFFYKEQNVPITRGKLLEDDKTSVLDKLEVHNISQVQTPTGEFFTRIFYVAHWRKNTGTAPVCCKSSKSIQWFPIETILETNRASSEDLRNPKKKDENNGKLAAKKKIVKKPVKEKSKGTKGGDSLGKKSKSKSSSDSGSAAKETSSELRARLWGNEVVSYAAYLKTHQVKPFEWLMQFSELTKEEVLKYVPSPTAGIAPLGQTGQADTQAVLADFVAKSGYASMDAVKIYSDFIQHSYPSTTMGVGSFLDYLAKLNLVQYFGVLEPVAIFRAMNYKAQGYLGFNEFLLGLIALDPNSVHGPARESFVFRYYDADSDGQLEQEDLRKLKEDLSKHATDPIALATDTSWRINLTAYLALGLKGVSNLCRATKRPLAQLYELNQYELLMHRHQVTPFAARIHGTCPKCRCKDYTLAAHSVSVNLTGCASIIAEPTSKVVKDAKIPLTETRFHKSLRQHSLDYLFNATSTANQVIALLRRLAGFDRMNAEQQRQAKHSITAALRSSLVSSICAEVSQIFSNEARVLKVQSPCYVLGDIHGNINDLLIFEQRLWQMAPTVIGPSVLFLGDYVDRGEFSVEVVSYLFAMKILGPNKFFMLRGNHEVRPIQRTFTFEKECKEKFKDEGAAMFETFNRVFDIMPFAAVIDESIFCAHGGIPFTHTKIEDLQRAPASIADPETEAPSVWEILWSDPITNKEYDELTSFLKKRDESGYLSNMKRSTAFYFGEKATTSFLKKNNLTHVIRAHEVINEGYKFNHGGRVITIFSSSHYCGGKNKAAAIMVEAFDDDGFLKIILLDTD